jgi:hypothetical protein
MQTAPVPYVAPDDRALPVSEEVELPPEPAFEAPRPAPAPAPSSLGRDDLHKLHAALHELGECRKLIDSALQR